jgi:pimeloyl-ACP methyl ester carboxylesterase
MPSTGSKLPTLLLSCGAWHQPSMWNLLIKELPDVDIRTMQLPSNTPAPAGKLGDLYDDAAAIRAAAEAIGRPCVVMAHSYGGAPMSQGLGSVDNVQHLIYLCAFQLDVGESMLSALGGQRPDFWGIEHENLGYYDMLRAEEIFYPDLEPAAAAEATKALVPQSVASMNQPLTQAAWRSKPSTYIFADNDVHPDAFRGFAARADRIRHIASAHSPFLSKPAELAAIVMDELRTIAAAG